MYRVIYSQISKIRRNTEYLFVFCPNAGKYGITPNTVTFYAALNIPELLIALVFHSLYTCSMYRVICIQISNKSRFLKCGTYRGNRFLEGDTNSDLNIMVWPLFETGGYLRTRAY